MGNTLVSFVRVGARPLSTVAVKLDQNAGMSGSGLGERVMGSNFYSCRRKYGITHEVLQITYAVCLSRGLLSYAFLCIPMQSANRRNPGRLTTRRKRKILLCHHDQEKNRVQQVFEFIFYHRKSETQVLWTHTVCSTKCWMP